MAGAIEVALRRLLDANNHLTLAECRDHLAVETGVWVAPWTVGRARLVKGSIQLCRMGWQDAGLRRLDWT
jgi:hypothetical protein